MNGKYFCILVFSIIALCHAAVPPVVKEVSPSIVSSPDFRAVKASHDLIVGTVVKGAQLVLSASVFKESVWQQNIAVERTFNTSQGQQITQVKALDQQKDGTGASVILRNGGPGRAFVTLQFESQRSKTIDFIVQVYAK